MARKWWTLLTVCVATFMLLLDVTIVNVALPSIATDLKASFSDLQWVVDAYALTLAALLLTAGSLGDRLGRRTIFAGGLVVFTLASLTCALAQGPLLLNISRGVQGIGAAAMFATSLALLAQEFQGRERGTAFGVWGAVTGLAVAVGPLVGGALVQGLGWQWIFLLNLPIGAFALFATLTKLPDAKGSGGGRIDLPGVVTFSGSLALLVLSLIEGNDKGWTSPFIVTCLTASALLMVAFVVIQLRVREPMLDLSLFKVPTFVGASIAAFTLSGSIFALFLYLTLYLQNVLGYGPLKTGVIFLPLSALSFVVAAASGKFSQVLPKKLPFGLGLGVIGVGLLLFRGITPSSTWTHLLAGFILGGIGIGLVNPSLASAAVGVVDPRRSGMASGINSTFRQVGIATGIAALGAVFQSQVRSDTISGLTAAGLPDQAVQNISTGVSSGQIAPVLQQVPAAQQDVVRQVANQAFIDGLNHILLIAAIIALTGAVITALTVRGKDFHESGQGGRPTESAKPETSNAAYAPAGGAHEAPVAAHEPRTDVEQHHQPGRHEAAPVSAGRSD